jgi:hypothetical protein
MKRRDVLLLRAGRARKDHDAAELSCEQLYMRYVDAEADGTTARLFEVLAQDLRKARVVRVTDRSWLAREDLKAKVDEILAAFVAQGGREVI